MFNPGDTIRSYKVDKVLNMGAFANSYIVSDAAGNSYFMKEYSDPKESDPIFADFYRNQEVIISRLGAMSSITEKFFEHFVLDGVYYQVKESLHGMDLWEWLSAHVNYEDRIPLSVIICGAIRTIHENRIVHQDLKPQQVMMVDDSIGKMTRLGYRVVISDFDWAIPDGKPVKVVGTPMYRSPEHYRNEVPNHTSDIFTLGIMIHEFLTGRNPFDHNDEMVDEAMIQDRVLNYKLLDQPIKFNNRISERVNNILIQCLNPDPAARPTIDEIQGALMGTEMPGAKPAPGAGPAPAAPPVPDTPTPEPPATVGLQRFRLEAGPDRMIVYDDKDFGRYEMKVFFTSQMDEGGNLAYQYCDQEVPMLKFFQKEGMFFISAPGNTKNYFLLNGSKIEGEVMLNHGDKLDLFSSGKSVVICTLQVVNIG
jgi:serine/threonine protein kinase